MLRSDLDLSAQDSLRPKGCSSAARHCDVLGIRRSAPVIDGMEGVQQCGLLPAVWHFDLLLALQWVAGAVVTVCMYHAIEGWRATMYAARPVAAAGSLGGDVKPRR